MSQMNPDALSRLSAANPAPIDTNRGHDATAQAALRWIMLDAPADALADAPPARKRTARRVRSPRGLALLFAILVVGVGGAVAATDPFGWSSSNPGEAQYGANPMLRVRTPAAQQIRCNTSRASSFRCTAQRITCSETAKRRPVCVTTGTGLPYDKIAAIPPPAGGSFSRAGLLAYIAKHIGTGAMTPAHAAKFRADLARVPDSFFAELRLASRFGTYGEGSSNSRGQTLVAPPGVPQIIVCVNAGHALRCRDLNGDLEAPIGAGVYGAQPGPGWRVAPPHRQSTGLPPGVHFTADEQQVLADLVRYASSQRSSSSPRRARAPRFPIAPSHRPPGAP